MDTLKVSPYRSIRAAETTDQTSWSVGHEAATGDVLSTVIVAQNLTEKEAVELARELNAAHGTVGDRHAASQAFVADIAIRNVDRELLRLIIAALRDKREQMLATQERERIHAIDGHRAADLTAGEQAHQMEAIIEPLRQAYKSYPTPTANVEFRRN